MKMQTKGNLIRRHRKLFLKMAFATLLVMPMSWHETSVTAFAALAQADDTQSDETQPDEVSETDAQEADPGQVLDDKQRSSRNGRSWRQRDGAGRFGQMDVGRFLAGLYDLKVEILPPTDEDPVRVLVDDEPVDTNTAAFFLRFLRQRKFQEYRARTPHDDPGEQVDEGPPFGGPGGPDGRHGGGPPHDDRWPGGKFRPDRMTVAGQMLDQELSPEFILDVMSVIQDLEPNLYSRLTTLQSNSPERFDMEIRRLAFQNAEMIELKRNHETLYELKVRDRQLENEEKALQLEIAFGEPEGEELEEYRQRLRELLESRFDVQMQMREFELERMAQRLDLLRNRLDDQKENKSTVVERQLDGILDELLRNR